MNPCALTLRSFIEFADSIINLEHAPSWDKLDPALWERFGFPTQQALHAELVRLRDAVVATSGQAYDTIHKAPDEMYRLLQPVVQNLEILPNLPPDNAYACTSRENALAALLYLRPLLTALEGLPHSNERMATKNGSAKAKGKTGGRKRLAESPNEKNRIKMNLYENVVAKKAEWNLTGKALVKRLKEEKSIVDLAKAVDKAIDLNLIKAAIERTKPNASTK